MSPVQTEVYSTREIARAAGVPLERVVAAVGGADLLVGHDEAVRVGRALVAAGDVARVGAGTTTADPA